MIESCERRVILHVDMDAFFAAIEQRNNPTLQGKPVIVGGPVGSRSVVSTCSYEARSHGVHSAMPIGQAFSKCPEGIFINVDPAAYGFAAHQIKAIFLRFSPAGANGLRGRSIYRHHRYCIERSDLQGSCSSDQNRYPRGDRHHLFGGNQPQQADRQAREWNGET